MVHQETAQKIFSKLNPRSESFSFDWSKDLEESSYITVESYLGLEPGEIPRIPVEIASRRELGNTLLDIMVDLHSGTVAKNKNKEKINLFNRKSDNFFINQGYSILRIGESKAKEGMAIAETAAFTSILKLFSNNVLGIYAEKYFSDDAPRLLLVSENIKNASRKLSIPEDKFTAWVLQHELTHVAQMNYDNKVISKFLRSQIKAVFQKDIGIKEKKEILDRTGAAMSYVEGMAEHVMDQAGVLTKDEIDNMRASFDYYRQNRPLLMQIINRMLGSKDKQYINGKVFCDAIVKTNGPEALVAPLKDATLLPSKSEIETPELWNERFRSFQV